MASGTGGFDSITNRIKLATQANSQIRKDGHTIGGNENTVREQPPPTGLGGDICEGIPCKEQQRVDSGAESTSRADIFLNEFKALLGNNLSQSEMDSLKRRLRSQETQVTAQLPGIGAQPSGCAQTLLACLSAVTGATVESGAQASTSIVLPPTHDILPTVGQSQFLASVQGGATGPTVTTLQADASAASAAQIQPPLAGQAQQEPSASITQPGVARADAASASVCGASAPGAVQIQCLGAGQAQVVPGAPSVALSTAQPGVEHADATTADAHADAARAVQCQPARISDVPGAQASTHIPIEMPPTHTILPVVSQSQPSVSITEPGVARADAASASVCGASAACAVQILPPGAGQAQLVPTDTSVAVSTTQLGVEHADATTADAHADAASAVQGQPARTDVPGAQASTHTPIVLPPTHTILPIVGESQSLACLGGAAGQMVTTHQADASAAAAFPIQEPCIGQAELVPSAPSVAALASELGAGEQTPTAPAALADTSCVDQLLSASVGLVSVRANDISGGADVNNFSGGATILEDAVESPLAPSVGIVSGQADAASVVQARPEVGVGANPSRDGHVGTVTHGEIAVGAHIRARSKLQTNSQKKVWLEAGTEGEITITDKDGDFRVHVVGLAAKQWITKSNISNFDLIGE